MDDVFLDNLFYVICRSIKYKYTWGVTVNRLGGSFWGSESILKLNSGDGGTTFGEK